MANHPNYVKWVEQMKEYLINHRVSPTAPQLKEFFGVTLKRYDAGNYVAYKNGIHFADVHRNVDSYTDCWVVHWYDENGDCDDSSGENTLSECRFVLALTVHRDPYSRWES